MARRLRPLHAAFLHLFNRGNERRIIFEDDLDRVMFLQILAEVIQTFGWVLHGYALMPNHYHLLVDVAAGVLSDSMRMLDQCYAQYFNRRWNRVGHLFQGRFGNVIVQSERHLDTVGIYTVLNPVRARFVSDPADWKWSSFNATAGIVPVPSWLHVDATLARFGQTRSEAKLNYQRAVRAAIGGPSPWDEVVGGIVLGDAEFVSETQELIQALGLCPEVPKAQRVLSRVGLGSLAQAVGAQADLTGPQVLSRENYDASAVFTHVARTDAGHPLRLIAAAFGVSIATASRLGAAGKLLSRMPPWDRRVVKVRTALQAAPVEPLIAHAK